MNDAPHKVMTPEEYAALNLTGWHLVLKNCDGCGSVGVRYVGEDEAGLCVVLSEENDRLIDAIDEAMKLIWSAPSQAETILRRVRQPLSAGQRQNEGGG